MGRIADLTRDNYELLEQYLEEVFLPNYMRENIEEGTKWVYYHYIDRLNFDEDQFDFVVEYLNNKGITIKGYEVAVIKNMPKIYVPKALTKEECNELLKKYCKIKNKKGKKANILKNKIIEGNIRFANYICEKYETIYKIPLDELQSCAYFALIDAVEKFDINKNASFLTFATIVIKTNIYKHLYSYYNIRYDLLSKAREYCDGLDIKNVIDLINEYYDSINKHPINTFTFHNPISIDGLIENNDIYSESNNEKKLVNENLNNIVNQMFNYLDERERVIINKYFGFDGERLSYRKIAEELGISHQRVMQLYNVIMTKLKIKYGKKLEDFLIDNYYEDDNCLYDSHEKVLKK